jgi:hypothetical protein
LGERFDSGSGFIERWCRRRRCLDETLVDLKGALLALQYLGRRFGSQAGQSLIALSHEVQADWFPILDIALLELFDSPVVLRRPVPSPAKTKMILIG